MNILSKHTALLCIVIIAFAVRIISLGSNPPGLTNDEANIGYDAYSLLTTGKDQWGSAWPLVSFRGFGDYRSVAYTYAVIPSVFIFGLNPFAVRLPSALFGVLTVIVVYFLVSELITGGKRSDRSQKDGASPIRAFDVSVFASIILAISPWHIGMSRLGIEETMSVFLTSTGLFFLLKGRRNPRYLYFGLILFSLTVYTYTANVLFVPLFIPIYFIFLRKQYMGQLRTIGYAMVAGAVIAAPIYLNFSNNALSTRTRQVNLFHDTGTIDVLNEKRGSCNEKYAAILCKLVFNKGTAFTFKIASNYANHFSVNLLGIHGTQTQYSILPQRGLLYLFDYPLIALGIYMLLSSGITAWKMLIIFVLLSAVPDTLTGDGHYGRFFISYPFWPIASAMGIAFLTTTGLRKGAVYVSFLLYTISSVLFVAEYATYFPYRYSSYSHYGYEQLVTYLDSYRTEYPSVIVSSRVNDTKQYIYYLFYKKVDPISFQNKQDVDVTAEQNGWVRINRIGNIVFSQALPDVDPLKPNTSRELLIGSPTEFPKNIAVPRKFEIKDLKGDVVFVGIDKDDLISCLVNTCL